MEEKSLEVVKKRSIIWQKIKSFFNSNVLKKALFIMLFFFICYIFMDLLNGTDVSFRKIFAFSIPVNDRIETIKNTLKSMFKMPKAIGNFMIYIFLYWLIYGMTNKTKLSCIIISTVSVIFGIINYIVIQVRGIAISISDIYSISTAVSVAKGIHLEVEGNFIVAIALYMLAIFLVVKFKDNKKANKRRVITALVGALSIFLISMFSPFMDDVQLWNVNNAYAYSGTGLTLIRMVKDLKIKKPDNYNARDIKQFLSSYKDEVADYEGDLPNIIAIMNESFSDLQSIFNFEMTEDNIPYYHELVKGENVVSGMVHSSLYGGGTANVEYEFLTQNTVAFLPSGSMPYQQYIKGQVNESIVSTINKLNYNSYGIHSWLKDGYSRGKVYKLLQFNNSLFYENMSDLSCKVNEYPSDESTYGYYYEIMKNKPENEKNFTFIVTMQNHLPYVHYRDEIPSYVSDNDSLKSYLQLESLSDDALKELINFLKEYDQKTVLVFFGDHQPNLKMDEQYEINEKYNANDAPYRVPFFIWANYDIEEKYDVEISTNYLQTLLCDVIGLPRNSYTNYMTELRSYIPILTANYYVDKDDNFYAIDSKESPYYDKIEEYKKVVYYQMFDNK